MKIKYTLGTLFLCALMSTAFATDPWNPKRCENGSSSVLTVTVANDSSKLIAITNSSCRHCGVNLLSPNKLFIPPGRSLPSESFLTCGYHSGDQNNDHFILDDADGVNGNLINILQADINYDNRARGQIIHSVYGPAAGGFKLVYEGSSKRWQINVYDSSGFLP